MAKKQKAQSAQQGKRPRQASNQSAQPRSARQRSGGTADYPQKRKTAAAPQQPAKPKRTNKEAAAEAATPGNILWRLSLILCVGLIVFSLLFASINGGSKYVGITYEKDDATPTPPVSSVDPNVNISGSDATPIPPSATPDTTETPSPSPEGEESTGGMFINGQPVTPE